jgi:hypothetical protein
MTLRCVLLMGTLLCQEKGYVLGESERCIHPKRPFFFRPASRSVHLVTSGKWICMPNDLGDLHHSRRHRSRTAYTTSSLIASRRVAIYPIVILSPSSPART